MAESYIEYVNIIYTVYVNSSCRLDSAPSLHPAARAQPPGQCCSLTPPFTGEDCLLALAYVRAASVHNLLLLTSWQAEEH